MGWFERMEFLYNGDNKLGAVLFEFGPVLYNWVGSGVGLSL